MDTTKPPEEDGELPRRRTLEEIKPAREWRLSRTMPPAEPQPEAPGRGRPPAQAPAETQSSEPHWAQPAPSPHLAPAAPGEAGLPSRYGVDRLALLVRDPHWTYSWWELTEARLEAARRELGEPCLLVLRFYDVSLIQWNGANHHSSFDIEIHDSAGNWYVEIGKPDSTFVAEIGWRGESGRFRPLVRSNFASLPRDSMSPHVDERWRIREEEYRRMFELSGGHAIGLGSGEIVRALEERLQRELLEGNISSFGISSLASRRET